MLKQLYRLSFFLATRMMMDCISTFDNCPCKFRMYLGIFQICLVKIDSGYKNSYIEYETGAPIQSVMLRSYLLIVLL